MLLLESYYSKIIAEHNAKYSDKMQGNMQYIITSLALKLNKNAGVEDYYANPYHAWKSYPLYLFRADKIQKWTNEKTNQNVCIASVGMNTPIDNIYSFNGYYVYSFGSQEPNLAQFELLNSYMAYQSTFVKKSQNEPDKGEIMQVAKRIRFFDMLIEEEINPTYTYQEIIQVMQDIYNSDANVFPLVAVVHLDEEEPHVHFLYLLDKSNTISGRQLKKIPHIENIIKDCYKVV